jgi:hypothetical protein
MKIFANDILFYQCGLIVLKYSKYDGAGIQEFLWEYPTKIIYN